SRSYKSDVDRPQYGSSGDREAAISADGTRLVTLTDNHTGNARIPPGRYLTVWDRTPGKVVREEKVAEREATTVLAPGGQTFALFSVNSPQLGMRLVSTETGNELRRLDDEDVPRQYQHGVACRLVFSPDGRLLATRFESEVYAEEPVRDKAVKVWDPATGREVARFPAAGPARFAFAPDGLSLVVAGPTGFRVFELATRREALAVAAAPTPGQRGRAFADALAVGPGGRTVATGHADGTILIWDATGPRTRLDAATAWAALADPDPKVAWSAVWRLAEAPELAVRVIGDKLKPAAADPATAGLVGRLDAGEFRAREEAERALRALGSRAEPALRAALAGTPSAELRTRAERLITLLTEGPAAGDDLRAIRAVQALEAIGTPEAKRQLEALARGDRHARLTREAQAAMSRASGR
ncbi:MAG TPA: hypothetical protein VKD90_17150, partial [Gemmataceae bacterium]|nr:hypothetical protein [Gemmataceae bacterium]